MIKKITLFIALTVALTGCFNAEPEDLETRTVPVTNNPHAMPGPMKTSPLPNLF